MIAVGPPVPSAPYTVVRARPLPAQPVELRGHAANATVDPTPAAAPPPVVPVAAPPVAAGNPNVPTAGHLVVTGRRAPLTGRPLAGARPADAAPAPTSCYYTGNPRQIICTPDPPAAP